MGNQFGAQAARVVGAVCSLGLTELLRLMSPQDQQRCRDASAELKRLEEEKKVEQARYDALKEERRQLSEGDIATYNQNIENFFQRQLVAVEKLPDPPKQPKFSAALLGKTSTGKTTTINAIYGTNERTSPIRCTQGVTKVHDDENIAIFDVFGDNDEETYHKVETLMYAKTLHKLVVVYTESVDSVINMARLCAALRVPIIFFRNKSENLTPEEIQIVREHDTAKLHEVTGRRQDVTLVIGSATTGMNLGEIRDALQP